MTIRWACMPNAPDPGPGAPKPPPPPPPKKLCPSPSTSDIDPCSLSCQIFSPEMSVRNVYHRLSELLLSEIFQEVSVSDPRSFSCHRLFPEKPPVIEILYPALPPPPHTHTYVHSQSKDQLLIICLYLFI